MTEEQTRNLADYRIQQLEKELKELEADLRAFKEQQQAAERSRLRAGVSVLGSFLMGILGILWQFRSEIFK